MKIREFMMPLERFPIVQTKTIFKEALEKMNENGLGIVCIVNDEGMLLGILTDGDIRRKILVVQKPFSSLLIDDAIDHSILNPVTIHENDDLRNAVEIMRQKQIWDLPVVNDKGILVGLLHLHPIVDALLKLHL